MAVNSTALKANVRAVADLFFSGSQTVTKGDEVIWILDETYAFKVTEKCAVSTNASPFVNLQAGDVFIIYKRTEADITAKNAKGIYIFDRDTVVGLAYPQEVTQDIVIENDIYANNYNSVVVEADKTPTAKITVSNIQPTIGDSIKVDGSSSYGVSPATITKWEWRKNGTIVSSAQYFTYVTNRTGQDDITLVVTDNGGRKGNASIGVMIKAKPVVVPPPVIPPSGGGGGGGSSPSSVRLTATQRKMAVPKNTNTLIFSTEYNDNMGSCISNLSFSYSLGVNHNWGKYIPNSYIVTVHVGANVLHNKTYYISDSNSYRPLTRSIYVDNIGHHVTKGSPVKVYIRWNSSDSDAGIYSTPNNATAGSLQMNTVKI